MNKTKWGIIGPGKIAGKFCTDLKEVKDAELYAVASRNHQKAIEFAKTHNATKAYGSYEEMLKDKDVDVVYIATPHVFHHEHTLLSLSYKKAVLCEKPFAINKSQVEEMIAAAKKENVFLMEAMWTQFLPHFEALMEIVASKKYGEINDIKADFGFSAEFNESGRLFNKALGGGSLLDIGIYPVFLALSLLGQPSTLSAKASIGKTEVDEECDITFEYPKKVTARLHSTVINNTPTTAEIEFEKASIIVNTRFHEPSSLIIISGKEETVKEFGVETNGYNFEATHVQEMLKQGRIESDKMTFEKSLQLIDLLDKVRAEIKLEY
ncbi:MAG: Gfo/Idh/MocA family oxidoreductase [Salegentibacter sp.]|uniref:Gfo/Idh/MocA family protein n=1 Tax=Salegentibacter sp. TaxID=1903072 RepID=UPI0028708229|nr:Gfo/Idh/MocA family oxidoreductase [Salegentibacter sp.]MDR9458139.1 Gfo/Idh/MocA family oxidoreductase [Salegentibacter sp.]